MIEFDPRGQRREFLGRPGAVAEHDARLLRRPQNNIWLSGNADGIVQKYSHDGSRLLLQIGTKGLCDSPTCACGERDASNSSTTLLNGPANVAVDPPTATSTSPTATATTASSSSTRPGASCGNGAPGHRPRPVRRGGRRASALRGPGPGRTALRLRSAATTAIQVFDKMGNLQRILSEAGTPREATIGSANDLVFRRDKRQTPMFTAGRARWSGPSTARPT